MRSVLSPRILARILRNEPIVHRDCLSRRVSLLSASSKHSKLLKQTQRRSLFGWIAPVPREAAAASGEKASLTYLKDACLRLDNQIRPPPTEEIARAWTTYVKDLSARSGKINSAEANYLLRTFELLKASMEPDKFAETISEDDLFYAMRCFPSTAQVSDEAKKTYLKLSDAIFDEAMNRAPGEVQVHPDFAKSKINSIWKRYIKNFATYGRSEDARDAVRASSHPEPEALWGVLLQRLSNLGARMSNASSLPKMIEEQVGELTADLRTKLSEYFAVTGDVALAKKYAVLDTRDTKLKSGYVKSLLDVCLKHNDLAWGREIIKTITMNATVIKEQKEMWTLMFAWALSTGKSVDEISRMMDVMTKTNADFAPTTTDINTLITIANQRSDPYLAERLIALGEKWGCQPDADTYLLQMDYRLSIGDVDGAHSAFERVKPLSEGSAGQAGPRVNALIQAMCARKTYAFDTIMDTVDFLGSRSLPFTAGTVASLAVLHLQRDEYSDTADLLSTSTRDFSLTDRDMIRSSVLDLLLSPETPISRLWDTYMIFQSVFEEAPRSDRLAIMRIFFAKERPDMATHVFNHMRRHPSPAINPDTETYVTALMGCGNTRDAESLAVINNVLKLDINVTETTRLHNARMIAFFNIGESGKAQAVWEDIVRSDEGPSRESLVAVFRVCEQSDFGEIRAREVWGLCRRMEVELDVDIVAAYVGALTGNGCDEDARKVVEECERGELGELEVGELILAKLFNGCVSSVRQKEVEGWIEEKFPDIWAKAKKVGFAMRYDGVRVLPMDVELEP